MQCADGGGGRSLKGCTQSPLLQSHCIVYYCAAHRHVFAALLWSGRLCLFLVNYIVLSIILFFPCLFPRGIIKQWTGGLLGSWFMKWPRVILRSSLTSRFRSMKRSYLERWVSEFIVPPIDLTELYPNIAFCLFTGYIGCRETIVRLGFPGSSFWVLFHACTMLLCRSRYGIWGGG